MSPTRFAPSAAALLAALSFSLASDGAAEKAAAELFAPSDVRLLPGPFLESAELGVRYVMEHDPDRLLAPFLRSAGLEAKAEPYGSWESSGLDGHSAGHFLSALATLHAVTGDEALSERLDYMLSEIARCQEANGDGYVGGVPNAKSAWERVAKGEIEVERFSLNGAWVPWYNLHKLYADLRDAWTIGQKPIAKEILLKLADWAYALTENLDDAQMQRMLYAEHGGMNEIFADLYQRVGDKRYLQLALRFSDQEILEPLRQEQDKLTGFHANTQIPKVVGFEKIALVSEHPEMEAAARFFWDTVVHNRSVAIGGNSVREHFHPAEDFSSMIESREGPESCNTHNMLRLTEELFRSAPSAALSDYYERALFNHILSVQHPETGGLVYFTPMRPRHYRVYSVAEDAFWCCVGSGIENPGRYSAFIYARKADQLFVNLFLPSSVTWSEQGATLRQTTDFPQSANTRIEIETLSRPTTFALAVRRPAWTTEGFAVRVNGVPHNAEPSADGYVHIRREWRAGDRLDVELPMTVRAEQLPDGSDYYAFLYGPLTLAAKTATDDLPGLFAGEGRMDHVAPGPYLPIDQAPTLVGDPDTLAQRLQPVAGDPLRFRLGGDVRPQPEQPLELEPFNRIHESRYMIYWRAVTPESFEQLMAETAAEEARKTALAARTLDSVAPGEQQTEVEHAFRGEGTRSGSHLGRRYREASQWFEYELDAKGATAAEIAVTHFGSEWGKACAIEVNGQQIGVIEARGQHPERFIDTTFAVPPELLTDASKPLTVRVKATGQQPTPFIFGIALRNQQ